MLVQQVVPPVASGTPAPMDIDGAPLTTMGPGRPTTDEAMPTIFREPEGEEELEEEEQGETDEADPQFIGLFRHNVEPVDEGNFDDEKEQ